MAALRLFFFCLAAGFAGNSFAQDAAPQKTGVPFPWQLGLQLPVTPTMEKLYALHDALLVLITVITLFVLLLLAYVCVRFSARNNPTPSRTTHNTMVEIFWTVIPILILIGIAIPSLRIHYFMDRTAEPQMTLKVAGYQWYWTYEYPDNGGINIESHIFPNLQDPSRPVDPAADNAELKGEPRLLTVDKPAIVPVDTVVRVLVTGSDVIHSWSVPAFGVKIDAVPGRVNETWFKATEIGTYRGQCSQLCGIWHGFMPIVVKVVSKEDFAAFVAQNKPAPAAPAAATPAAKTDAKGKPAASAGAKASATAPAAKKPATKPAAPPAKKPGAAQDQETQ